MLSTFSDDLAAYASSYQASRNRRCEDHQGLFLPLEVLVDRGTGAANLSVSFSGTSGRDVYVTQRASLIRAVKVTTRWFIVPWTVARVLTQQEFVDVFSELLEAVTLEEERFWVFRAQHDAQLKRTIASLPLDETFREQFEHGYLPEPGASEPGS